MSRSIEDFTIDPLVTWKFLEHFEMYKCRLNPNFIVKVSDVDRSKQIVKYHAESDDKVISLSILGFIGLFTPVDSLFVQDLKRMT